MTTATVTSKGQITVPKEVRDELKLEPGAVLSFSHNRSGEIVVSRVVRNAAELAGALAYDGPPKSLDDMDAGIAAGAVGS